MDYKNIDWLDFATTTTEEVRTISFKAAQISSINSQIQGKIEENSPVSDISSVTTISKTKTGWVDKARILSKNEFLERLKGNIKK